MIDREVSHYKIQDQVGGGGMGIVYRAEDTKLRRTVALKFLPPELTRDEHAKKRFLYEAQAASALDHPNICNIHEIDSTDDGQMFISMAYYEGTSLKARLASGPLPPQEAFEIAASVADGLTVAHSRGIIHRDIKPGNIMITSDGFVKIVDFGLAKLIDRTRLTRSDFTLGTVAYMSPETATGEDVDGRTDIWSLGVVMYEMLTGKLPFRGNVDQAMVYSILNENPKDITEHRTGVPKGFADIIMKCLSKDPKERFQTADELRHALVAMASGLGWQSTGSVRPVHRVVPVSKKRHRLAVILVASAVVVVLLAVNRDKIIDFFFPSPDPLYSTKIRVAVLPFDNLTHPKYEPLVGGLTKTVTSMAEKAAREHDSMWIMPHAEVQFARVATDDDAREAFGVSHIVTGDLQRYGVTHQLRLELKDAGTLEPVRSVSVRFDPERPAALVDSLGLVTCQLFSVSDDLNEAMLTLMPSSAEAVNSFLDGLGLLEKGDSDGAISQLQRATTLAPELAVGISALGMAYWSRYRRDGESADLDRAIEHLQTAVNLPPPSARTLFDLGDVQRRTGADSAAVDHFKQALELDPGNPRVAQRLADVYRVQDRVSEAADVLRTTTLRYPDYFPGYRNFGLLYYRVGDYNQAIKALTTALDLAPKDAFTLNTVGACYHQLNEFAEARTYFERAFHVLQTCETCENIALMLYYDGRYAESASYFEYAQEFCDSAEYWHKGNWAASLYWIDGQREKATKLFKQAIELAEKNLAKDPDNSQTIADLTGYYAMIGDREQTVTMIEKAKPYATDDVVAMYSIANAYALLGDRRAAIKYLSDAVRHGYPLARIKRIKEFEEIVQDPILQRMIEQEPERQATDPQ